jgi:glc operon protein GlcG
LYHEPKETNVVRPVQSSLPLDAAAKIVDEALAARRKENLLPLAVAVLDSGGHLVAFKREDGCGVLRFDIALGKAWGTLGMGVSSRTLRDRLKERPTFQAALVGASEGRFIAVPGGVLVVDAKGVAIGAVGISGDTSEKDEYCAIAGIKAAGLQSDPAEPNPEWNKSAL